MNTSCDLGAWGKPGNPGSQLCAGSAESQPSYLVRNHPECEPPRYRWHLGCILLKVPAISLRTGLQRARGGAALPDRVTEAVRRSIGAEGEYVRYWLLRMGGAGGSGGTEASRLEIAAPRL